MSDLAAVIKIAEEALAAYDAPPSEEDDCPFEVGTLGVPLALRTLLAAAREAEAALAEVDLALENVGCPPMGQGARRETLAERIERLGGLVSSTMRDEHTALEGKVAAEAALAEERRRREEAERHLRTILDNHHARLTERGILVWGQPVAETGFAEALRFLAAASPAPQPTPLPEARTEAAEPLTAPPGFDPICPRCDQPLSCHVTGQDNEPICDMTPKRPAPAPKAAFGGCGRSGCRAVSHKVNDGMCPGCKRALDAAKGGHDAR